MQPFWKNKRLLGFLVALVLGISVFAFHPDWIWTVAGGLIAIVSAGSAFIAIWQYFEQKGNQAIEADQRQQELIDRDVEALKESLREVKTAVEIHRVQRLHEGAETIFSSFQSQLAELTSWKVYFVKEINFTELRQMRLAYRQMNQLITKQQQEIQELKTQINQLSQQISDK